jgi:class 3 adenylate cyclase
MWRKNDCSANDEIRLTSDNAAVTLVLRRTEHGLLIERTQRQAVGVRLVQTLMFADLRSFDHWCTFEPLRFEDGLLFGKLVREGHAVLA